MTRITAALETGPVLGLRENLAQFSLLVLVNAFVGGMVGLERVILPLIAEQEFGLVSKSAILSFIVGFGFVKAFTNLAAGRFSDRIGRKALLVGGWIVGLPPDVEFRVVDPVQLHPFSQKEHLHLVPLFPAEVG